MRDVKTYIDDGDHVPVFPLPDFVLFPGVSAPLHVFEPRYRQMIEDVLDRRGVFCMGVLRDGWRGRHLGNPDFWGMGCACHLVDYNRLDDGRYFIVVEGLVRVRMKEVASRNLYRRVKVNLVPPIAKPPVTPEKAAHVRRLMERILRASPDVPDGVESRVEDIDLSMLLSLMAFHCPVPVEEKLKLLYAPSDAQLCDRLIKLYETVEF